MSKFLEGQPLTPQERQTLIAIMHKSYETATTQERKNEVTRIAHKLGLAR